MYIIGYTIGFFIARRLSKKGYFRLAAEGIEDLVIWLFVGMLIGARLVYMLVYWEPSEADPFRWYTPFAIWQGGLAFHGAVIGMAVAAIWFAKRYRIPFWNLGDTMALAGSPGIIFGRIGNFINSELYGRVTDGPMGIQFPIWNDDGSVKGYTEPRHPSQLYEAFGEGLIPLAIIWLLKPYVRHQGIIGGLWICLYAVGRFVVEFFREKDAQLEYYFGWMTMGQILCALMFLIGAGLVLWNVRFPKLIHEPSIAAPTDQAPGPASQSA
jgi:phosphatidylglycerol:prolipoprotein diacylglycerol transferase